MNTLADSITKYNPSIRLTKILSRSSLSILRSASFAGMTLSAIGTIVSTQFTGDAYSNLLLGSTCLFAAAWLEQMLTFGYHNSYYFRGLNSLIGLEDVDITGATYDVAKVTLPHKRDVTLAFCSSRLGSLVLMRTGLQPEAIDTFLSSPRQRISADMVTLPEDEIFSVVGLGKHLLTHDIGFHDLIKKSGITEETFLGALRWVVGSHHQQKRQERWWSKDNLSRTSGIGRDWAYGVPYSLKRYSRDIRTSAVFSTLTGDSTFAGEKIIEIESALTRSQASNVLIIGEAGVGKMDLVLAVQERIRLGQSLDAITGKNIVPIDANRIFATHVDKHSLETTLISMLNETAEAGNTIIVIENLSTVIQEAYALGVFLPELLDSYLAMPQLQFIFTDTPGAYHTHLETLGGFVRRFAEVLVDSPDLSATTRLLQNIAETHETRHQTLFTYSALSAVTTAADRYVVEGVMPDKAIGLLIDVATAAEEQGVTIITEDLVYAVASEKTGVPVGPIKDEERDLLLHLEDKLHHQVVGQQAALSAIARTMRRARAGIQSADKPIGSFLFLGPTGVGKTETAKALAKIFFGGEDKLQRIDMSEFSGNDALERLIGDGQTSGVLSTILHEHPYCVLLLDEFEKANQLVHDLFLQILDEGIFTDARGMKINSRNTIIIATSNAGSQLIMRTVEQRKDFARLEQEILDNIIRGGVYRPELINRFDDTVIFEPLNIEQQTEVASLMLGGLYKRVRERGYEVSVDRELLDVLVEKGYNPEFGARPMQRVLQDVVEEKIAQKIISGEVQKGDTIKLSQADFSESELAV